MDGLTRFIREESNNTRIKYEPSSTWSTTSKTSSIFQIGNMGAPVSTLLEAAFNGSVSFTFEGIAISAVISYINPTNTPVESKVGSCSVDNDSEIFGATIPPSSQNNWQFCSSGILSDGIHTFTMNFSTPQSVGSPRIFFDYFLYAPSPTEQFSSTNSDVSILIESSDPVVTYSGSVVVESDTDSARLTNSKNASITVPFFGQQLSWYGAYSTSIPSTPSSAEYSIDGGTPTQFTLDSSNAASALLNQLLFQTEVLPQGSHQLTATYLGDAQAPLSLSFVVVRNFSSTTTTDSTTVIPFPTTIPPPQSSPTGSHNPPSTTIGIVVGVLIFFLVIIGVILRRHIKKRVLQCLETRRKSRDEEKEERPEMSLVRDGTMPAVSIVTITPDPSEMDVDDIGVIETNDSLLILDRNTIFNAQPTPADSTETLLNASLSYTTHTPTPTPTLTPFEIPRLPVMDVGKMAARRLDNSQDSEVHHSANDADNSNIRRDSQQLQLPSSLLDQTQEGKEAVNSGSSSDAATARAVALQMLTRQPLRLSLTPLNVKEMHMDSGVRLGNRQTLIYDETSSAEWSLRSKRRLPPGYTHD